MRVAHLGGSRPEVAVVGSIHGDEPCGARAIERLLIEKPSVEKPVKLVVANEEALDRGVRYVDADLNRAFEDGGDPRDHEYGLARRLAEELAGCTVLSIHSTQSHPRPFGIVTADAVGGGESVRGLPSEALVEVTESEGRPFVIEAADLMEVEAGYQQSPRASANAYRAARAFLEATGVLPGQRTPSEVPTFRLGDAIEKPAATRYEAFAKNFARVEAGEVFAVADERELRAENPFYPVLFSAHGYRDIFGYTGQRVDG
jgi:succinylglutamate desuccinylase